MKPELLAFDRLLTIMDELREQCPWDKKQTMESLRHLTIEETYELGDAILDKDMQEIKGELGDLFLHLVFYSKIGSETKDFDVTDVLNGVCDKLIRRHPHIYADTSVEGEEEVKANWEKIKLEEKRASGKEKKESVLEGVPKSLPSLVKAMRIQEKVQGVGFKWDNGDQAFAKVKEELDELHQEIVQDSDKQEEEFGDVLFALINYAKFLKINPEQALEQTNRKFINRFMELEKMIKADGEDITDLDLNCLENYWNQAKVKLG